MPKENEPEAGDEAVKTHLSGESDDDGPSNAMGVSASDNDSDWEGPDYSELAGMAPFDGEPEDYTSTQRRAEIYGMIRDAGHPSNLEANQSELGKRYGVSQPLISKDIKKLREFEAAHNSTRAKAVMGWLAESTVKKHIAVARKMEANNQTADAADRFERAMETHMEYVDYLFDTGDLDESPDSLVLEGDAGEAYMEMLRQANDNR